VAARLEQGLQDLVDLPVVLVHTTQAEQVALARLPATPLRPRRPWRSCARFKDRACPSTTGRQSAASPISTEIRALCSRP
jgi:hypothetical protein